MKPERLKKFTTENKAFLHLKRSKQPLVFIFFLLLAGLFWFIQSLNERYDTDITLNIKVENVPEGVLITDDLPDSINVTVNDVGATLLGYMPFYGTPSLIFDFAQFDMGIEHGHIVLTPDVVTKAIQNALQPTTQVIAFEPDTLEFFYSRDFVTKKVPVKFRGVLKPDALYYLDNVVCAPDSVTVTGDKNVLDTLHFAYTTHSKHTDLRKNISFTQHIAPIRGVKIDPLQVKVNAFVDVLTQCSVEIPIRTTNFPADISLRTFPSRATVTYQVGMSHYRDVVAEQFALVVTYEELLQQSDSVLTLKLRSIPNYVTNVQIEPREVQYILEKVESEADETE